MLYCCVEILCSFHTSYIAATYGTDFVFGFLDLPYYNSSYTNQPSDPDLSVIVTLKGGTTVHITTYSTGSASKTPIATTKSQYVYQYEEFHFNSTFINKYQDTSPGKLIKIRSDDPMSVMTVYEASPYKIVNPVLPSTALSTSYVIPSYQPNTFSKSADQFLVISLNESTEVRFEGYETGNMVYPLSQEEIFVYERTRDLSSTTASSNHPVALFSSVMPGNLQSAYGKDDYSYFLSMQVPPMDRYATHFIVPSLVDDVIEYYKVRIYAPVQNAFVEIHSSSDSTQKVHVYHKIFYELTTHCTNVLEIVSDQQLIVVQIALTPSKKALFMTNVPAASQYLSSYTTAGLDVKHQSPSNTFVITIPFSEASGLIINRKPMEHNPTEVNIDVTDRACRIFGIYHDIIS